MQQGLQESLDAKKTKGEPLRIRKSQKKVRLNPGG